MTTQTPSKIGKYDIVGVLGRGAMGVVYRGHDAYVDRPVAIKLATNSDLESDPSADGEGGVARRLFINEARSAGRLDHPNILKVYEAGESDGQPYMVMEFIDGADTLRNHCGRDDLLPISQVVSIIRQVADALDYAHRSGVLHRDIKPANIMLTREGAVKLGDFGIARRMGADQTQIVGWFGSPLYMSPEQARDSEVTPQSDLFSLGSVFYEMLAGVPPFAAKGLTGLIQKVCYQEPAPLPQVRPEVSTPLWLIVKKMLEKDLRQRYVSGAEIVRDIDALEGYAQPSGITFSEEERLALMKGLAFFQEFTQKELKEIVKVAQWQRYGANQQIFREGERDRRCFVIVQGGVGVDANGTRLFNLGEGSCFGEMEYLADDNRMASTQALRETTVLYFDRDYREWASLPCQVRLSKAFQRVLVERLKTSMLQLTGVRR